MRLKLSEWASLAEIISAVAVIVSLLYVGFELNQNTEAIRSGTHQALLDSGQVLDQLRLANPELNSVILRAERGEDGLTAEEISLFRLYAQMTFSQWENAFLNHGDGLIKEEMWPVWDTFYRGMMRTPAYRRAWAELTDYYEPSFRRHVDDAISAGAVD